MGKFAGFSSVELTKPRKSMFDLSHYKRLTTRMGNLTPCFITECVPSDVFNGSSEVFVRLAPLLAPIYDNIVMYVHFFFVPNRLLWEDWEEFITGGRLGVGVDPVLAPIPPWFDLGPALDNNPENFEKSSLADYLGCPIFANLGPIVAGAYDGKKIDLMPWLAYQKITFDYYRDRNFEPDENYYAPGVDLPVPSGEYTPGYEIFNIRVRKYGHDYFTSALPFTQRGEEVLMPLAGSGSVTYKEASEWYKADGVTDASPGTFALQGVTGPPAITVGVDDEADPLQVQNIDQVLLNSSSVSINDFRSAYALQVWLERNAVGGSRYTESTQAHFGVRPQDSRLQRAEYIGGGRVPVQIKEIVSTAWSTDGEATVPLANLAGQGTGYGNTNRFHYFCPEHGFIIGMLSFLNEASYDQGLPRMFRRRTFLDYPWPTFANLGEQQVDKAELYANPANLTEDVNGNLPLFGYQSRYADWKVIMSKNHGDFHDTLLFWTLTRTFDNSPELGLGFVNFDTDVQNRIFALNDESDNFWLMIRNQVNVRRPLPYFGKPNTLGFS